MEDIQKLGTQFRQRRKEMDLSLKEVENSTSIRMNFLQAIEEGQVEKLISPIYAQGFVKQYGKFLGLDVDPAIQQCSQTQFFGKPQKQEFDYGIGSLEVRANPGLGVKWIPNILWIFGLAAVLLVAWFFAKYLGVL